MVRALERLDQKIYKPGKTTWDSCIGVDSTKFAEMFFVAGSIPWIDTKGKWIKCPIEDTVGAAVAEAVAMVVVAEAILTAPQGKWPT